VAGLALGGTIQYSCQKTPHKIYKLCNTPLYQQ